MAAALVVATAVGLGTWWSGTWPWGDQLTFEEALADTSELELSEFLQLMHPPPSTRLAFDRAERGEEPTQGVLPYPLESGRSTEGAFAAQYQGGERTLCLGFKNEAGNWDVLRSHWRVGAWTIEAADLPAALSIRISSPDIRRDRSVETVRSVAETLFRTSYWDEPALGIVFRLLGDDGHYVWGDNGTTRETKEVPPEWSETLWWYHDGQAVGFIGMRANRGFFTVVDREQMKRWLVPWVDIKTFVGAVLDQGLEQHLNPPQASLDAMQSVSEGGPATPGLLLAFDDERVQNFALLAAHHQVGYMDQPAHCVGFAHEAGKQDVVRCRHRSGDMQLNQIMTPKIRVLWLNQPHDGDNELAHAQGVVSELFRRRGNWTLVVHGQDERGVWGHVVRRAMTTEVARVSLFWWATRDGQVGFSHRNWDSDPEFIEDWFEPTP